MDKFAQSLGAIVLLALVILLSATIGALGGAIAGWIIGFIFGDTILNVLANFGVKTEHMTMWQFGMTVGFVGGFMKTKTSISTNEIMKYYKEKTE